VCEKLLLDFAVLSDVPADPFRLVRTLKAGKDLYDVALRLAEVAAASKPKGFPSIRVEHSPFCPPGNMAGLDVNGRVVLMIGPRTRDLP